MTLLEDFQEVVEKASSVNISPEQYRECLSFLDANYSERFAWTTLWAFAENPAIPLLWLEDPSLRELLPSERDWEVFHLPVDTTDWLVPLNSKQYEDLVRIRKQEILSVQRTEVLLHWRKACYRFGGHYDEGLGLSRRFSLEEIKAELAKREHVPNKVEKKKKRQETKLQRKARSHWR